MKDWHGLIKILEIQHIRNGKIIWEAHDLYNMLHLDGELFMLTCCFDNDGTYPPTEYYFGLDNRPEIVVEDVMADLVDEPVTNGYLRQSVSSAGGFTIDTVNGVHRASCQIITFTATGTGYGPVSNLFCTDKNDQTGFLIASAPLSNTVSLVDGDAINMRMALALQDDSN